MHAPQPLANSRRRDFWPFRSELRPRELPSGRNAGVTITYWLVSLHMAHVWGLSHRIFVCSMGLVVAMLSATGVYIWWMKRAPRRLSASRSRALQS